MHLHKAQHQRSRGFTLLEVMVALAVIGVALPALLFQVQSQTANTSFMRERTLAQWVAQNKMTEFRLLKRLKGETFKGKNDGDMEMAGVKWRWEANSEKTPLADDFRRITITVGLADSKDSLITYEGIMSE